MSYEFEQIETEKIELQKRRDFGEKINATFEFIKLNFAPFYKGIFFMIFPIAIFGGIASSMISFQPADFIKAIMSSDYQQIAELQSTMFGAEYFIALFLNFLGFVLLPAYVYSYVRKYAEKSDDFSVSSLFRDTFGNFFKVLGASILIVLLIIVAYFIGVFISAMLAVITPFLGIVSGLATMCLVFYLGTVLSLVYPIMLVEGQGFGTSLSKSFYLIKDKWWSTFGLLVVMGIIYILLSIVFSIPLMIVTGLMASNTLGDTSAMTNVFNIIANIISQVGGYLILPFTMIAICFQYFNLSEMKESTGLISRIDGFGKGDSEDVEEIY